MGIQRGGRRVGAGVGGRFRLKVGRPRAGQGVMKPGGGKGFMKPGADQGVPKPLGGPRRGGYRGVGRRAFLEGIQRGRVGWFGRWIGRWVPGAGGDFGGGAGLGLLAGGGGLGGFVRGWEGLVGVKWDGGAVDVRLRASGAGMCSSAAHLVTSHSNCHLGHSGSVTGWGPSQAAQSGVRLHPSDGCSSLHLAQRTALAVQARCP